MPAAPPATREVAARPAPAAGHVAAASRAFALSAVIPVAVALAAWLLAARLPGSTWTSPLPGALTPLPPGAPAAAVALMAAATAALALPVSEALAFGLLTAACLGAGLAARAAGHVVEVGGPVPDTRTWMVATLLADAGMFGLGSLVLTAWAAAPRRSLGRWVAPLGVGMAAFAIVGSVLRTSSIATNASVTTGATPHDLLFYLSGAWRSGITLAAPLLLGSIGALRAAGRDHLSRGRPEPLLVAEAGPTMAFWAVVAATLGAWVLASPFPDVGPPYGAGLPSLLWLLVAVVVVRWSAFAGWGSLAASLALSAERPLTFAQGQALATVDPLRPLGDPVGAILWLPAILLGWAMIAVGVWAGWRALVAVRRDRVTRRFPALALGGTLAVALIATGALGPVVATFILWAPPRGWPIQDAWTPFAVLAPVAVGAMLILRARLVPAVAEAEAAVGGRFAPSEYLTVLAAESVTRGSQVRVAAQEAERARLASDIHAEVLPTLTQVVAASAAGAPPDRLAEGLRAVEAEVRDLMNERRFVLLEEFGLVEALEWVVERAQERGGPAIELDVDDGSSDVRPPRAVERAGFRIGQLAIENSLRHAHATTLRLDVLVRPDEVRLRVDDDGVGLPAAATEPRPGHLGIADMRSQADQVGGRLELGPGPAGGTRVTFRWGAR